jgi:hypothetical protein
VAPVVVSDGCLQTGYGGIFIDSTMILSGNHRMNQGSPFILTMPDTIWDGLFPWDFISFMTQSRLKPFLKA